VTYAAITILVPCRRCAALRGEPCRSGRDTPPPIAQWIAASAPHPERITDTAAQMMDAATTVVDAAVRLVDDYQVRLLETALGMQAEAAHG
jgi:hypothetical protein